MSTPNYVHLFTRAWRTMLLMTVIGLVAAIAFSFVQPLKYSSTERILIIQTNLAGVDPYTAIKSTERIAQNLSEIIYTSSFFNAVMSKTAVDPNYFPQDENAKRRVWRETIATEVAAGTGVMSVVAYHTSREQAAELAVRVSEQLAAIAPNYFGYSIRAQIIDDPLPSRFFAKPNVLQNGFIGAIVGFLLGGAWVLARVRTA